MTHSVASSFSPGPVFLKCIPLSQLLEETSWKSSHYTAVIESWDCFWLKFSNYFSSRESDDFRNTLFFFIHLPMIFQLNKNFKQVRGLIKLENEFPRVGISVFAGDLLQYLNSNFFFIFNPPFQFAFTHSWLIPGHHWQWFGFIFFTLLAGIHGEDPPEISLLQAEQSSSPTLSM